MGRHSSIVVPLLHHDLFPTPKAHHLWRTYLVQDVKGDRVDHVLNNDAEHCVGTALGVRLINQGLGCLQRGLCTRVLLGGGR